MIVVIANVENALAHFDISPSVKYAMRKTMMVATTRIIAIQSGNQMESLGFTRWSSGFDVSIIKF